jgi:adenosylcobinamide kinase / adenosylcobinamide-phosphate guanylyltransferase
LESPQISSRQIEGNSMQEAHPNTVTFVLGGVRSGKSRFAQRIASASGSVIFIATARPSDPEMELRIERHRQSRPAAWQTLEIPVDLDVAIASLQDPSQLAVIDCLTVYLANIMSKAGGKESIIKDHTDRLCSALKETRASIILVSNEVGSGIHATTPTGRFYCDLLGELNQQVAAVADNVILMVAGIPVAIKGTLPVAARSDLEINDEVLGAARL